MRKYLIYGKCKFDSISDGYSFILYPEFSMCNQIRSQFILSEISEKIWKIMDLPLRSRLVRARFIASSLISGSLYIRHEYSHATSYDFSVLCYSRRQEAMDMLCDLAVRKLSPGTSSGSSSCKQQSPGASCNSPRRLRRLGTRTPTAEMDQGTFK